MSRRVSHRVAERLPFLRLTEIEFKDTREGADGKTHKWNLCERVHPGDAGEGGPAPTPSYTVDAVDICAVVAPPTKEAPRHLVILSQYRAPVDSVVLEFPAGLVDKGEKPEDAALRELKEETGFVGTVTGMSDASRPLAYEPGLSNSCFRMVQVAVDPTLPENLNPQPQLDAEEDIAVHVLPFDRELLKHLSQLSAELEAQSTEEKPVRVLVDGLLVGILIGRVPSSSHVRVRCNKELGCARSSPEMYGVPLYHTEYSVSMADTSDSDEDFTTAEGSASVLGGRPGMRTAMKAFPAFPTERGYQKGLRGWVKSVELEIPPPRNARDRLLRNQEHIRNLVPTSLATTAPHALFVGKRDFAMLPYLYHRPKRERHTLEERQLAEPSSLDGRAREYWLERQSFLNRARSMSSASNLLAAAAGDNPSFTSLTPPPGLKTREDVLPSLKDTGKIPVQKPPTTKTAVKVKEEEGKKKKGQRRSEHKKGETHHPSDNFTHREIYSVRDHYLPPAPSPLGTAFVESRERTKLREAPPMRSRTVALQRLSPLH